MAGECAVFVGSQEAVLQEANQPLAAHAAMDCSHQSQMSGAIASSKANQLRLAINTWGRVLHCA